MTSELKPSPRRKIRGMVIKRKDDFLTALEKNWRDWALRPLTSLFDKIGIIANYITYLGFILIAIGFTLNLLEYPVKWQLLFLVLAFLSDGIDGPTARNNDNVTILGTWLDHIRDGFIVIFATLLIYQSRLLAVEWLMVALGLEIILIWIILKDYLIRYLRGLSEEEEKALTDELALDNLQASVIGRTQFFSWVLGYIFLLAFLIWPLPILITIGQSLIIIEIIFCGLNIWEAYQRTV
ncbi:MAG: CDP-alcohol phosphatidyltransferase family protein [bacterium]|nr:CDP-alcohol phosphatidyltransferase family protein [bacterium]